MISMDGNLIATFALLVGLEIVLGIDNILLISILTDRLPVRMQTQLHKQIWDPGTRGV